MLARWISLAAIAVVGSAWFGASLAHVLPGWDLLRGALWLTLSAGTGWLLLGPVLIWSTRQPMREVADACLLAMASGEAVLFVGGIFNFGGISRWLQPVPFNAGVVAVSNLLMAYVLASRLRRRGASVTTVLLSWFGVLDGGGALAFWLFYRLLFGGGR